MSFHPIGTFGVEVDFDWKWVKSCCRLSCFDWISIQYLHPFRKKKATQTAKCFTSFPRASFLQMINLKNRPKLTMNRKWKERQRSVDNGFLTQLSRKCKEHSLFQASFWHALACPMAHLFTLLQRSAHHCLLIQPMCMKSILLWFTLQLSFGLMTIYFWDCA